MAPFSFVDLGSIVVISACLREMDIEENVL